MSHNYATNRSTATAATNALSTVLGVDPTTLHPSQRKDAAWRLVWLHKSTPEMDGTIFTLASLAALAGTTPETISVMRRRKRFLREEGRVPSGSWAVDISDYSIHGRRQEGIGEALEAALKETLGDIVREAGR